MPDTWRFSFEPLRAPMGGGLFPTHFDSCISPRVVKRPAWWLARKVLGLDEPGESLDQQLRERYARHLLAPGLVERFVLLAFDAVFDDRGRELLLPEPGEEYGSDIYTSNSLILAMCRMHPDRYLFGASIHPYRSHARAAVEEVFRAGACLLKWLPLHQNIDFADDRTLTVMRACAELGLPLLIHVGEEFTLSTQYPEHRPIGPLLAALRRLRREGCMPKVIVAHLATPVTPWGNCDDHAALLDALTGEFASAPLYADISAMTAVTKARFLMDACRRQELHHKLVFGSDFPVPVGVWALRRALGREYAALRGIRSWPQQAARACRTMGFNDIVFERAGMLLPHVEYFASSSVACSAP